jgi:hypothetical protein
MIRFVTDDHIVVAIDGLRFVRKNNQRWSGEGERYILAVTYKGQEESHAYENEKERDDMYNRIRHALGERNSPKDSGLNIIDDLTYALQYILIRDKLMPADYEEVKSIAEKWKISIDESLIPKEIEKNAYGEYTIEPGMIYRIFASGPLLPGEIKAPREMKIDSVIELCKETKNELE